MVVFFSQAESLKFENYVQVAFLRIYLQKFTKIYTKSNHFTKTKQKNKQTKKQNKKEMCARSC